MGKVFSVSIPFVLASVIASAQPSASPSTLVLEGVIVAANPADSIALVRRDDAKRARAVRVGERYGGLVLVAVERDSAWFEGARGSMQLALGARPEAGVASVPEAPDRAESRAAVPVWVRRSISRVEAHQRLEREIPVILSDTELTPRVVEGEVRGLELLRLPDGTVLAQSGLRPGDVLRSINEQPLRGLDSLWNLLARFADDDELRIIVERRGEVVRFAYDLTN